MKILYEEIWSPLYDEFFDREPYEQAFEDLREVRFEDLREVRLVVLITRYIETEGIRN